MGKFEVNKFVGILEIFGKNLDKFCVKLMESISKILRNVWKTVREIKNFWKKFTEIERKFWVNCDKLFPPIKKTYWNIQQYLRKLTYVLSNILKKFLKNFEENLATF